MNEVENIKINEEREYEEDVPRSPLVGPSKSHLANDNFLATRRVMSVN